MCSDFDDDCDATTSQDGMVRFVDSSGTETDLATSWSTGSASSPVSWSSADDGILWVCADTWYVNLFIDGHEVDVLGPDGAGATLLDGAADGPVIEVGVGSVVYPVSYTHLTLPTICSV